jgi:hypothetical protein
MSTVFILAYLLDSCVLVIALDIPQAIGCSGAGGSIAFADPANGLSIAILKADYTETRLGMEVAERLIRRIREHAPRVPEQCPS